MSEGFMRSRVASLWLVALAACQAGRTPPVARIAEPEKTGSVGMAVELDGSGSGPGSLAFQWRLLARPDGSRAALGGAAAPRAFLVPDAEGVYLIELRVSDPGGLASQPAQARIEARCGRPPRVAIAEPPGTLYVGAPIPLAATVSQADAACADPHARSYRWWLVEQPEGSAARIVEADDLAPVLVPDVAGRYVAVVEVVDQAGRVGRGQRALEVSSCGSVAPVVESISASPVAPAVGQTVVLDAVVGDPDNLPPCNLFQRLTRSWKFLNLPRGSFAELGPPGADAPQFVPDVPGTYVARLTVTDSAGQSAAREIAVEVLTCGNNAPVVTAAAAPAQSTVGGAVVLSARVEDADTGFACALQDGHTLFWHLSSLPAGSQAALSDPTADEPQFVTDRPGLYKVQVVAKDRAGLSSAPFTVEVEASACGDGRPTAFISATAAPVGMPVQLSGTASDPDMAPPCSRPLSVSWRWWIESLPPGAHVHLSAENGARPYFVPDRAGTYLVRAQVTDETGRVSPAASVQVDVPTCGGNRPHVVASPSPATPDVGQPVSISAAALDADSEAPCFFAQNFFWRWWIEELPAGSAASLANPEARSPSFTPDLPGRYVLRGVATDQSGLSGAPATVVVDARACGGNAPTVAPTASPAGALVGTPVLLDAGAADLDALSPCGRPVRFTYAWSLDALPLGSAARLSTPNAATPSFVPDRPGGYVARVVVTDETARSSAAGSVEILVADCGASAPTVAPVASTPAPATGQIVTLDAGVQDPDALPGCGLAEDFTYVWTLVEAPAGSQAMLDAPGSARPSFTPDVPGTYVWQVSAQDAAGHESAPAWVTVVASTCGAASPTAAPSASPSAPRVGETVLLASGARDADTEAGCTLPAVLRHRWWFEELPAGSQAALSDPAAAAPRFAPDLPGTYKLRVEVVDGTGRTSGAASLTVNAIGCGANAPAVSNARSVPATPPVGVATALLADLSDADTGAGCGLEQQVSLLWRLVSIPAGSLASLLEPARFVPDAPGAYAFEAMAVDSTGRTSAPVPLTVTASACGSNAPTAAVTASPASVLLHQSVQVTAIVADADNASGCAVLGTPAQVVTPRWTLASAPLGSMVSLPDDGATVIRFAPDVAGSYVVQVVAEDSTGRLSAPAQFTITAAPCGDNRPVAFIQETSPEVFPDTCVNAVRDLDVGTVTGCTAAPPPPFQFDAACSYDLDNAAACSPLQQTLSYEWAVLRAPVGSTARVQPSTTGRNAWFQIDTPGDYLLGLRVNDGRRLSEWATVHMAQAVLGPPTAILSRTNFAINSFSPSMRINSDGAAIVAFRVDDGFFQPADIMVGRCVSGCNDAANWRFAGVDCDADGGVSLNRYGDDPFAYEVSYIRGSEAYFARCSAGNDSCFNQNNGSTCVTPASGLVRVNVTNTAANAQLTTTFAQARKGSQPASGNLWIAYPDAMARPALAFCPAGGTNCNSQGNWCNGAISISTLGTSAIDGQPHIGLHVSPDGAAADVLVAAYRRTTNNGDLVFRTCRNTTSACGSVTCLSPANWSAEVVLEGDPDDDGDFVSIWRTACDAPREAGRIHIGYVDETNGSYKYATCLPDPAVSVCPRIASGDRCLNAANWQRVVVSPSPMGGGVPATSMFVSPRDGLARIAVHHHTGTFGLRLLTNRLSGGAFDVNNWRTSDVVCGNAGHEPSLWIHSDGSVRVAHSRGTGPQYELYFYEP